MRLNDDGERLCDSADCALLAITAMLWTDGWHYYCHTHAQRLAKGGEITGFPAAQSARPMTADEMMPEADDASEDS